VPHSIPLRPSCRGHLPAGTNTTRPSPCWKWGWETRAPCRWAAAVLRA